MFVRITILSAMALTLAGCGGGGEKAGDPGGAEGPTATAISMTDNAFDPAAISVGTGSTLELTNDGQAIHNFTVERTDVDVDVEAGQSASQSIDLEPGSYTVFCEYHRAQGMEGTLEVA